MKMSGPGYIGTLHSNGFVLHIVYCQRLRHGLIGVMGLPVGEEEVDGHADDGEEEDHETPDQLVDGRAVGLEDLDCRVIDD